jgi:hypothetical protein
MPVLLSIVEPGAAEDAGPRVITTGSSVRAFSSSGKTFSVRVSSTVGDAPAVDGLARHADGIDQVDLLAVAPT